MGDKVKKVINLVFVYFLFIVGSINVHADMCDMADVASKKELVKNITYRYEWAGNKMLQTDLQSYRVTFDLVGLDSQIYLSDVAGGNGQKIYNSNEALILQSGSNSVYVYYDNCRDEFLGIINIDLKKFNPYSLRSECLDVSGLEICDEWYQGTVSEDEFLSLIHKSKAEDEKVDITSMSVSEIISTYYFYFIGVCVLLIVIIVILTIRHIKSNRLD